jgi:hypothetical protein
MTTLERVDALAKQLSAAERAELAKRWLAEERVEPDALSELDPVALGVTEAAVVEGERDPIYNLGKNPASGGDLDGTSELDKYLYDRSRL